MAQKPNIHGVRTLAKTRLFHIEAVELEFANGAHRVYERINNSNAGAVMVLAITQDELLLIREYAVGAQEFELGFVKGLIDAGETPVEAADRELKEEIGFGARHIELVRKLKLNPHYTTSIGYTLLAQDLYPASLPGDEPEPLEIERWPLSNLESLLHHPEINDVRTLQGIYWLRDYLDKKQSKD